MSKIRKRFMLWLLVPLAVYVVLALVVWLLQDRLIFVAAGWGRGAAVPDVPGVSVRWLERPGGERFRVAVAGDDNAERGIVFFVGNGEDLRSGVHWAALWAGYGLSAVVVEYPGYGDSEGAPGGAAFFEAADAGAAFARARLAPRGMLISGGSSIGSFSALHVAARGACDRLFLRAPPTSLAAAAKRHYPWLPVGLLLRHDLDNLSRARDVECPALVLHGDRDRIVPLELGRALAEALSAQLVVAEGYGHNDLPCDAGGPFGRELREFLFGS